MDEDQESSRNDYSRKRNPSWRRDPKDDKNKKGKDVYKSKGKEYTVNFFLLLIF